MKKIGILVYDASLTGGAEKVAIGLANELSNIYEIHLISLFNEKEFKEDSIYNFYYLENNSKSLSLYLLSLSKKLKKYLLNKKIEILLNITAGVNTISILATRQTKIKIIYCEHSNLYNKTYGKKHIFRQWLGAKYCDYVIALTNADKKEFIRKYGITMKCDYIYNWYNVTEKNTRYNIKNKSIISVGRLEKVKGYDRLIEVAKIILENNPEWTWDIYGDGTLKETLQNEIDKNGLTKKLFLKGNVSNLQELYFNYAFLVLTSYYEGLPLALLEAQSNNLPIISFDCKTGPSEIISNYENGFLIENGNISEMINKINHIINNNDLRLEFSKNAKNNIDKFDKEEILKKWISLIEKV